MAFFRRTPQPTGEPVPDLSPREQRRLIRESDRQNYTSHGYRALSSYAFAKDIVPGKLFSLIHDQLTEGGGAPRRDAVWVGVHDVDLERGAATVMGRITPDPRRPWAISCRSTGTRASRDGS